MYCQFLEHADIASFLKVPSTPLFLMKFDIWVPNMIIFVMVYGLAGGCLEQKFPGNSDQSEQKLPRRSEKTFCITSITHVLQSVRSNFAKKLLHVFIQV